METGYTAFSGLRCVASGGLAAVAGAVKELVDRDESTAVVIFDDSTGRPVDLDLRGTRADVLARVREPRSPGRVGRPRLGVVGREVTLLDRHWAWLSTQPGGASAALRRLVDAARHANEGRDRVRRSQEAAHRFMTAIAGDLAGYEEALRALFAGDRPRFESEILAWPNDVRLHAAALATDAFAEPGEGAGVSIEIHLKPGIVGAEITGVDLREPLDAPSVETIRRAWLDRGVLVFRGQRLSPEDQLRFTAHFGAFQRAYSPHRNGAKVNYLGKGIAPDGVAGSYGDGIFDFHQDGVYREKPTKVTFLFSLAIPSTGGNTKFASTYAAYDVLAPELRERCLGYDLVHAYAKPKRDHPDNVESFTHPLVVAHAETGRPLVMCDRAMSTSIVGLPPHESDALLEQLCAALERPEHVYEHVWRVGDLVMWDNLATAHARTDYDSDEPRMMQRTSVQGTKPVAYRDRVLSAR